MVVLLEILSDALGQKNVSRVAAIHHALRHVDPATGEIDPFVYIHNPANGPAMDSHPKLQARMLLKRAADLHRALRGRFWTRVKDQHHPVASWDPNQTVRGFGSLKLFGGANNPVQFLNRRVLVVNRKLRVTDNICEQHMRDFQLNFLFNLGSHMDLHGNARRTDTLK